MSDGAAQPGTVYLCGAGPGDPSLLTLRAARLLTTAEIILPDDLVTPEILALANPSARIIPVGKRCGQPRITQAGIHALMLEHARPSLAGHIAPPRSVLRLKSGDPLIFGRAGEEIDALEQAGIPYEIVPGITAAFAIAASLKTPLTDRASASRLVLATGHHSIARGLAEAGRQVPAGAQTEPRLGRVHPDDALALYMPGRDFLRLRADLVKAGFDPATPVAAVTAGGTDAQQTIFTSIDALASLERGAGPLLLLIGKAIRMSTAAEPPSQPGFSLADSPVDIP